MHVLSVRYLPVRYNWGTKKQETCLAGKAVHVQAGTGS